MSTISSQSRNGSPFGVINIGSPVGYTEDNEVNLWRAVITQAFVDACWVDTRPNDPPEKTRGSNSRGQRHLERQEARTWLQGACRYFEEVCDAAEVDPDAVREAAKRLEANGWGLGIRYNGAHQKAA